MAKTTRGWDVLDDEAGILTREYVFSASARSRMMTARLRDGRLLIVSPATGLTDADFDELERFGQIGALVAPNSLHHLGLPLWNKRYPDAKIYAPSTAHARIKKKQPAIGELHSLDALAMELGKVRVLDVPGQRFGETWVLSPSKKGPTWYVADSCFSMPKLPPALVPRMIFKLTNTAPGFKLNGFGRVFVNDRKAYRRWFLDRLEEEAPSVVLTGHGAVVEAPDLRGQMRSMAEARL